MKQFFILFIVLVWSVAGCKNDHNQPSVEQPESSSAVSERTFFPVSVWYSGGKARAPMLSRINNQSTTEWKKDLQNIKDLGFNTVRTWVEWSKVNPKPDEYHFENLKLLADLANQVGLKFIIQLYVDSAPDWIGHRYPEGRFVTQSDDVIKSQVAPGYCTDHEEVRAAVLNFIRKTAGIAMQYPNFHGWDLWSEPHIVNWAYINYVPNVQFCYCSHTKARFRSWLKNQYIDINALNDAWYRNFQSWDEVDPPRFGTILSYTDFIDWKNFIYEKLANDLAMRYQAVRDVDKTHVITSHAAVPSIFYSPYNGYGATDDFLMADQVDYYGTSLYPKHNHPARHWEIWKFMVALDFSRSANRSNDGFYVGELQAGHGTIGLNIGDPVTPGDHRVWLWSAVAKGAKGMNIYAYYPMSSGYESGGYGLINLDGSLTERAKEAGKTARIIHDNRELILSSEPFKAEIAIVYNPLAQMVGGEQRHTSADMHQQSLFGYYRFFAERDIPVDFIHRHDLENSLLDGYSLVILPYPLMLTEKAVNGIMEYVANGGHLISEARPGWNNEFGYASERIPGMGLDAVFGARETKIKMTDRVMITRTKTNHPLLLNIESNRNLKGSYFAESFEIDSQSNSAVLAHHEDGSPAIIENTFKKGKCLLIGTFLGRANHIKPDPVNNQFLWNTIEWAQIDIPVTLTVNNAVDAEIEARIMQNDEGYLFILVNHGTKMSLVKTELNFLAEGKYRIRDLLSETSFMTDTSEKTFSVQVAARDVRVFHIQK